VDGKAPPRKQAASVLQQQTSKSSAKEQKAALARTQRLLNDNAPITRSVTAAFKEKHVRRRISIMNGWGGRC